MLIFSLTKIAVIIGLGALCKQLQMLQHIMNHNHSRDEEGGENKAL